MNAVTKTDPKPMLLDFMADKAGLRPDEFSATVRKTCGMISASAEEFAAFLMVAREYNLNPLTKEIYAFPAKGGGIVPIVSIDGWVNLVNSHPACDGFEFDVEHDEKGELVSITCRMYRNDRSRPVSVTEYYDECKRGTDPWKMKHRMLRHKAMIQAARYAFGFSGIYDEDEGAKIAEMRDVTPKAPPAPPKPPVPPQDTIQHSKQAGGHRSDSESAGVVIDGDVIDAETGEVVDEREVVKETGEQAAALLDSDDDTIGDYFERMNTAMAEADDAASIAEIWNDMDPLAKFEGDEESQALATSIKRRHVQRVGQKNG